MTPEELKKALEEGTEGIKKKQKELEDAIEQVKGGEVVKKLEDELETLKGDRNQLANQYDELVKEVNKLKTTGGLNKETIKSYLDQHLEDFRKKYQNDGKYSFNIKAATLRASVANNTAAYRDPNISPLAHRTLTMYDLFRKVPVGVDQNGTVRYYDWDEATTARAATAVAEGAAFPESTAAWVELTLSLQKVGDTIPFSDEFNYDSARFEAELENFLTQNVRLKEDADLLMANGTAPNIFGLDARAVAYTPAASGITDANIYDLIEKVDEDITTNKGAKFSPNVVIMNIADINKMKLKKDANNNYIMPPFVGQNGQEISGKTVLRNDNVTAGVMYVGDSRYGTIYESAEGYSITVGEVDAQFKEDMKTLKARKRMNLLIKNSEQAAWRKVASISTALTTLAS